MENREKSWSIFERTGSIVDYLNYTACTKEDEVPKIYYNNGDGRTYGNSTGECSWDCFVSNAGGRT